MMCSCSLCKSAAHWSCAIMFLREKAIHLSLSQLSLTACGGQSVKASVEHTRESKRKPGLSVEFLTEEIWVSQVEGVELHSVGRGRELTSQWSLNFFFLSGHLFWTSCLQYDNSVNHGYANLTNLIFFSGPLGEQAFGPMEHFSDHWFCRTKGFWITVLPPAFVWPAR